MDLTTCNFNIESKLLFAYKKMHQIDVALINPEVSRAKSKTGQNYGRISLKNLKKKEKIF